MLSHAFFVWVWQRGFKISQELSVLLTVVKEFGRCPDGLVRECMDCIAPLLHGFYECVMGREKVALGKELPNVLESQFTRLQDVTGLVGFWGARIGAVIHQEDREEKLEMAFHKRPQVRPCQNDGGGFLRMLRNFLHSHFQRAAEGSKPIESSSRQRIRCIIRSPTMGGFPEISGAG